MLSANPLCHRFRGSAMAFQEPTAKHNYMAKKPAASAPALSAEQLALIQERDAILAWLEPAKARELEIRNLLVQSLLPSPVEGANRLFTADGFEVYIDHKINRKLDVAALDSIMPAMDESYRQLGVLIDYKPALVLDGYRALPDDQRKIFQQALTETPGTPTLNIQKVEATPTPIMDAYEKAKNESAGHSVRAAASSAPVSTTGHAAAESKSARLAKIKAAAAKPPKVAKAAKKGGKK